MVNVYNEVIDGMDVYEYLEGVLFILIVLNDVYDCLELYEIC